MEPPLVVRGQDSVGAPPLKAADEGVQAGEGPGDELGAAEGLQTAAVLDVELTDQVVDADGRVTVGDVEPTTCGEVKGSKNISESHDWLQVSERERRWLSFYQRADETSIL